MDGSINIVPVVIEENHRSSIWKLVDDPHIPRMSVQCILTKCLEWSAFVQFRFFIFFRAKEIEYRHSWHESPKIWTFSLVSSPLTNPRFIAMILKQNVSQKYGYIVANPGQKRFVSWQSDVDCLVRLLRYGLSHVCPPKTNINKEYCEIVMEVLLDHILWKQSELLWWWILHRDNAGPHMAALVQEWL